MRAARTQPRRSRAVILPRMTDKEPIMMPTRRHVARQGLRCTSLSCLRCVVLAYAVLALGAQAQVQAQTQMATPTPQQMVDQLKNPRTRSLRNLSVEAVPATASTAPATVNAGQSADSKGTDSAHSSANATSATSATRPALSLLIQFDFNSARVRPESQQALSNLSQALQSSELAGSKFAVEGHTDARGSGDYNQKLSQQRALAVRDILASNGVAQGRLLAVGWGAALLANSAEPFAAENRRVRIVNLD